MLEGLPKAGFGRIAPPDGAFYVYADVSDAARTAASSAARMLDEAGVAVTPGLDFDPRRGAARCASPTPARPPTSPRD